MATKQTKTFPEIGVTGLNQFNGYVREEFLRELSGDRWRRTIREMSIQDSVIVSFLFTIKMLIRKADWQTKPASDDQADIDAADFVDSCLHDMGTTWEDLLSEILSMLPYGWSYFNTVYKVRQGDQTGNLWTDSGGVQHETASSKHNDGKIGWAKWSIRSQDTLLRWEFAADGRLLGMWQLAPPSYAITFIPLDQCLLFRTATSKANPEGESILRGCYRAWYFKKNVENLEGIGLERDLAGIPEFFVPGEIMADNASAQAKSLFASIQQYGENLRNNEQAYIILPSDRDEGGNLMYDMKLLSAGGAKQFNTNEIIARWDQRILMTAMAGFIMLGHTGKGSHSLSTNMTEMFCTALGSWLDSIADIINRVAIPRLLLLNGMSTEKTPMLTHGGLETIDLVELGNYVLQLSQSGMTLFPDEDLEAYLRQKADMPLMSQETRDKLEAEKAAALELQKEALKQKASSTGSLTVHPAIAQPATVQPQGEPVDNTKTASDWQSFSADEQIALLSAAARRMAEDD